MTVAFRPRLAAARNAHCLRCQPLRCVRSQAEKSNVSREYSEETGEVTEGSKQGKGTQNPDGTFYIDEQPVRCGDSGLHPAAGVWWLPAGSASKHI